MLEKALEATVCTGVRLMVLLECPNVEEELTTIRKGRPRDSSFAVRSAQLWKTSPLRVSKPTQKTKVGGTPGCVAYQSNAAGLILLSVIFALLHMACFTLYLVL